jgi:hypothetical protein
MKYNILPSLMKYTFACPSITCLACDRLKHAFETSTKFTLRRTKKGEKDRPYQYMRDEGS